MQTKLLAVLAIAAVSALLAQGPLAPPGAPAPAMKTLQQIEPRIEINAIISSSLTSSAGILAGVESLVSQCLVSNSDSTAAAFTSTTGMGISLFAGSTVERCTVQGSRGDGIRVSGQCLVRDNMCDGNGNSAGDGAGIHVTSTESRIEGTTSPMATAASRSARAVASSIAPSSTTPSTASTAPAPVTANYIQGCLLHSNDAFGIFLQGNGNTVIKNQVGGNTGGSINQTGGNIAPTQNASEAVGTIHPLANFQ